MPRPLEAALAMNFRLEKDRLLVSRLDLSANSASVTAQGALTAVDPPAGTFDFQAKFAVADLVRQVPLPVLPQGQAQVKGKISFQGEQWNAAGDLSAQGIGHQQEAIHLDGVSLQSRWKADPQMLRLDTLHAKLLGGDFAGQASFPRWSSLELSGVVSGLSIQRLNADLNAVKRSMPQSWSGAVSGPVELSGGWGSGSAKQWAATARLSIEPGSEAGAIPVSGLLDVDYNPRTGHLAFGPSHLNLPHSNLHFQGAIEDQISFGLFSTNLDDLLPALSMVSADAPKQLPLRLETGTAHVEGRITGSWNQPQAAASIEIGPFSTQGHRVSRATAQLQASPSELKLSGIALQLPAFQVTGDLRADLDNWKLHDSSRLQGTATLREAPIEALLAEANLDYPVKGRVSASLHMEGTYGSPRASGSFAATGLQAWDQPLESFQSEFRLSTRLLELVNGHVRQGGAVMEVSGSFERRGQSWNEGDIRFQTAGVKLGLSQIAALAKAQPDVDGLLSWKASGTARVSPGLVQLSSLDSRIELAGLTVSGHPAGQAVLTANTAGRTMRMNLNGGLRGASITGNAEWSLGNDSYGLGQLKVDKLTLEALQQIGLLGGLSKQLPITGYLNGELGFSGPVLRPESWTAAVKITTLVIEPRNKTEFSGSLRNQEPMMALLDAKGLHVQSAHMVGEGTDLEATGLIAFRSRNPWNLQLKGSLNLPALATWEPDLLATGTSTLDASIRGSLAEPQVTGRLEIKDGSFYLRGVPNGLEQANGVILFDRNRATIAGFTARTGGGDLKLDGFIGFGGEQLVYRLQANAQRVRVRYPEDVSTTFDAALNLTGTAERSMLSGLVTINKMGLNPRTDIGRLLAETGASVSTPAPPKNDFLRGMQLDVHIQTSPDAELQTSLTRDIQPEAELWLRGSPAKLVLRGRVSVNQGEIQFFGNRYDIRHGDISFFNPVSIEPVLNLDLETRVRGITVTINFSGPIAKLNVSYRSDPPLQSTEIVALLTVGRTPGSSLTPSSVATQSQSSLQSGVGNSLLGQAIASPVTGSLERLFGVSRIKIDPDLTGVSNTPQARLTLEQQVTRDITITYITNLNRTQQQIVRLQWDFSRSFSVLAVRDENGIFGVDFLFRKRFR
ncbi:MAG: translocation/assembly module TamB domain-containing protein [Acidobacteriia bacterium]|nr:translocation/assembly module TamB domain-containing protein [Terriglobia bacterium]